MVLKKAEVASVLRALADLIEGADEASVRQLLAGHANLRVVPATDQAPQRRSGPKMEKGSAIRWERITEVHGRLRDVQSLEAAYQILEDAALSRKEVESLARLVDVPVRKDVRIAGLEGLIVNATVGGRLNSRAIKGS